MTKNDKIIYSSWLLASITLLYVARFAESLLNTHTLVFVAIIGFSLYVAWIVYEGFSAKLSLIKYLVIGIGTILLITLILGYAYELRESCDGSCIANTIPVFIISEIIFILFAFLARGTKSLITRK